MWVRAERDQPTVGTDRKGPGLAKTGLLIARPGDGFYPPGRFRVSDLTRGIGVAPYAGTKDVETPDSGTAAQRTAAACARKTADGPPVRFELPLTGTIRGRLSPAVGDCK